MKWLTKEQVEYIREHPLEPPRSISEKLGCNVNTVYHRQYSIFGKEGVRKMKARIMEERNEKIREMWPSCSSTEIAEILGIGAMTIASAAKRMKLRHNAETTARLKQKRLERLRTPEARAKIAESLRRGVRVDRWLIENGMKPRCKRKYNILPRRVRYAKSRLRQIYDYFIDDSYGDVYAIYYDSQTNRLPPEKEEYYSERYSLKFVKADDDE